MNISANTLFHFTKEKKFLLSILKNGLFIRYSLETYGGILKSNDELVLPMCCFCDIPLSQVKEHTKKYGSYSIGLSKEWGMRNGISPVLYAHKKSDTAKLLNSLTSDLDKIFDIEETNENEKYLSKHKLTQEQEAFIKQEKLNYLLEKSGKINELSEQLGHFLKYIKPYEGRGYSNGKEFEKVRFYDEKEWRYVPPKDLLKKLEIKDIYKRKFYTDERRRRYINIQLAKHKKLSFTPKDIKFIVVKKDSEIPEMIENLRKIFQETASYKDLMILNSRLISLEQIVNDL